MKKPTHTPGPWIISCVQGKEDELMVGGGDDGSDIVCDIRDTDQFNASLISAAPDLLEALQVAVQIIEQLSPGELESALRGSEPGKQADASLIVNAFAKAKGDL